MVYRKERGRPLKFKDVKLLQKKIEEYFAHCDPHVEERDVPMPMIKESKAIGKGGKMKEVIRPCKKWEVPNHYEIVRVPYMTEQEPYTVTGLAVYLDTCRDTLITYQKTDEFFDTIKRAKEKVHEYAEKHLYKAKNPNGGIFALKNNFGWKDQSEVLTKDVPTGFEHLSDEELNQKLEELRREQNHGDVLKTGNKK